MLNKSRDSEEFFVALWVKDPVLSLQQLGSLLWHEIYAVPSTFQRLYVYTHTHRDKHTHTHTHQKKNGESGHPCLFPVLV